MQRSFPGVEDRASAWFCSCDKKATSCGLSLQIDLFKNSMIASESSLRVFFIAADLLTPMELMGAIPASLVLLLSSTKRSAQGMLSTW